MKLAITGSSSRAEALLVDHTGDILAHTYHDDGLHVTVMQYGGLTDQFDELLLTIARKRNIEAPEMLDKVDQIVIAIAGTDHRFQNPWLFAHTREWRIPDGNVRICGVSEAVYRGALDDQPGIVFRSGTGASVFAVNADQQFRLASALAGIIGGGPPVCAMTLGQRVLHFIVKDHDGIASPEETRIARAGVERLRQRRLINFDDTFEVFDKLQSSHLHNQPWAAVEITHILSDVLVEQAYPRYYQNVDIASVDSNPLAARILNDGVRHFVAVGRTIIGQLQLDSDRFAVAFDGTLFHRHPRLAGLVFEQLRDHLSHPYWLSGARCASRVVGAAKIALCQGLYSLTPECERLNTQALSAGDPILEWTPVQHR